MESTIPPCKNTLTLASGLITGKRLMIGFNFSESLNVQHIPLIAKGCRIDPSKNDCWKELETVTSHLKPMTIGKNIKIPPAGLQCSNLKRSQKKDGIF